MQRLRYSRVRLGDLNMGRGKPSLVVLYRGVKADFVMSKRNLSRVAYLGALKIRNYVD